jgi:hypothetical protein
MSTSKPTISGRSMPLRRGSSSRRTQTPGVPQMSPSSVGSTSKRWGRSKAIGLVLLMSPSKLSHLLIAYRCGGQGGGMACGGEPDGDGGQSAPTVRDRLSLPHRHGQADGRRRDRRERCRPRLATADHRGVWIVPSVGAQPPGLFLRYHAWPNKALVQRFVSSC